MPIAESSVTLAAQPASNVLALRLTGKLDKEDYEDFVPMIESAIEDHGTVRLFIELVDFDGWTAPVLWEDLKFDVKHYFDVERIAIVGRSSWEKAMTTLSKPFTAARVSYFDESERDEALRWIELPNDIA